MTVEERHLVVAKTLRPLKVRKISPPYYSLCCRLGAAFWATFWNAALNIRFLRQLSKVAESDRNPVEF